MRTSRGFGAGLCCGGPQKCGELQPSLDSSKYRVCPPQHSCGVRSPWPPVSPWPCGVPWGLAARGQGQDELRLCWAGMSKGP